MTKKISIDKDRIDHLIWRAGLYKSILLRPLDTPGGTTNSLDHLIWIKTRYDTTIEILKDFGITDIDHHPNSYH